MKKYITTLIAFAIPTLVIAAGDFLPLSRSDSTSRPNVHTAPSHVKLPSAFPRLNEITRVDIYEDRWAAGIPRETRQHQTEFNLFSITNINEISELYECLQTDIMLPAKLTLGGYASFQNWYSGTNLIIQSSLLNAYSTVSVNYYKGPISKGGIGGKSESFAQKIFEYHAKHIDGFTKRFFQSSAYDKSPSIENQSFWKPSKQWKAQQKPAP